MTGEAGEGALLVEHLARHERETEQLTVRMGQRGARLAAVVDDRLCVPDVRGVGVVREAALESEHELTGGDVVEAVERLVVVGRVHEHLVHAGALGGDVDGTVVVHGEPLLPAERRVQVGHDTHPPLTALADRLERRGSGLLVAGAEGARTPRLDVVEPDPRCEVGRSLCTLGDDRHPTPGQLIQSHLTHREFRIRRRSFPERLFSGALPGRPELTPDAGTR